MQLDLRQDRELAGTAIRRVSYSLLAILIACSLALPVQGLAYAADGEGDSTLETPEASVEPETSVEQPSVSDVEPPNNAEEGEGDEGEPVADGAASLPDGMDLAPALPAATTAVAPAAPSVELGGNARNLVVLVRFKGDTTGDGGTGYNTSRTGSNGIRTDWEYLVKQFNEDDPAAYVKGSFRTYLKTVSDGKHDVVTDFPQTNADGTVQYLTLPYTRAEYEASGLDYDYKLVPDAMAAFREAYPAYDASRVDLNGDGCLDNVLVLVTIPEGESGAGIGTLSAHKSQMDGGVYIGSGAGQREVRYYNIINTKEFGIGVAAHEYLHTLGTKDYYRKSRSGFPVGVWDIMAESGSKSWPLAVTRQTLGWTSLSERSESGTYTLHAPGSLSEQAFMFKSPLSDSEYFVAEYRKKGTDVQSDLDLKIGGSGLIVYRVNPSYADLGNVEKDDYVYVFRPNETGLGDASAGEYKRDLVNAQLALHSYVDVSNNPVTPRSSIGVADFAADVTQGALCYADGRNSGIVIETTAETDDSITFKLTYPDYTQTDLWDTIKNVDGSAAVLPADVNAVQTLVDGQEVYAVFGTWKSYQVMRYDGSTWHDLGVAAQDAFAGRMAARDGKLYFLASKSDGMVLRNYDGGSWKDVATVSGVTNANEIDVGFIGETLYLLAGSYGADSVAYRLDGSSLKRLPKVPVNSIAHPALFELDGHPAVACGDSSSKSYVFELAGDSWTQRSVLDQGSSSVNAAVRSSDKTYVYQYPSAFVDGSQVGYSIVLEFAADGTFERTVDAAVPAEGVLAGSLVSSGGKLYLALLDGRDSTVRVFSADAGDLSTWTQFGNDVYKPAGSFSMVAAGGKLFAIAASGTGGQAVMLSHTLPAAPVDPTPVRHTVTFKADGKVVREVEFSEGDASVEAPEVPSKEGYSGAWEEYQLGSTDLVVEAVYAPRSYTITFKNWDGSVLLSREYPFGASVTAPNASRLDEGIVRYAFTDWSPTFSPVCKGSAEYTAQYRKGSTPKHTVTFTADGTVVGRVDFFEGSTLTEPSVPQKTGYAGVWEAYALGTRDLTVRAVYTAKAYTVTFKNWNNDVLSSRSYTYGSAVAVPVDPTRPDSGGKTYAFAGWSPTFSSECNGDAVYTAQFSERAIEHTIAFVADGKTVGTAKFNEVDRKLIGSEPAVPVKTGYTGTWPSYTLGNQDVTVSATYRANRYAVTFKNWDGSTLQTGTYEYRSLVKAPLASRPLSDGKAYEFVGWSPAFSGICDRAENAVHIAQYRARSIVHYAAFEANGAVIDRVPFSEGDARLSRVPAVPSKAGYSGAWELYSLGSDDIVVKARYSLQPNALTLATNAHVQNKGWIGYQGNGSVVGTTGSSLRMESIRVRLEGALASSDAMWVQAHVQNIGWMSGLGNDKIAGTTGRSLRIEAMKLTLNSRLSLMGYRVYYRVHAQNVGWMGWAHDGAAAGTAGNSLRLEAIQIVLVAPGEIAPANAYGGVSSAEAHPYIDSSSVNPALSSALSYDGMVHVQNIGNVSVATNGARTLGTTGRGLRLEGLKLSCPVPGVDLSYRTHVQNIGWQNWVGEGALSGTQGRALRLEALQIKLSGSAAGSYDVYYRTHVQNFGWTGWARNGQQCGSAGYGYRMEAVQVMIVPKGGVAPGLCTGSFFQR